MTFLQRAREKAAEVAREAADATTKAAGAVSAKAHDPATQQRLKDGLSTAGHQAGDVAREAAGATSRAASAAAAKAQDPATQERVKAGLTTAGRQAGAAAKVAGHKARTIVERIDPGILADLIIKATALQESTNAALRRKGSPYRIAQVEIAAAIPAGITFAISRIDDVHELVSGEQVSSEELLEAGEAGEETPILTLDVDAPGEVGEPALAGDEAVASADGSEGDASLAGAASALDGD